MVRAARMLGLVVAAAAASGCLERSDRTAWLPRVPLLRPTLDENTAYVEYVIAERTAGGADINRRAWDRVDEQVLPFETRQILEAAGLRVGIVNESAVGPLRNLMDQPRTAWGHRSRVLAVERPAPLVVSPTLPRAEFTIRTDADQVSEFARGPVVLGFEMTVKPGRDGKVAIAMVPRARYPDPSRILTLDAAERGQATEHFSAAAFEVELGPTEFLVVGTDEFWPGTFGHAAFTYPTDERRVQRLLILRAVLTRPGEGTTVPVDSVSGEEAHPPIAAQAAKLRDNSP